MDDLGSRVGVRNGTRNLEHAIYLDKTNKTYNEIRSKKPTKPAQGKAQAITDE